MKFEGTIVSFHSGCSDWQIGVNNVAHTQGNVMTLLTQRAQHVNWSWPLNAAAMYIWCGVAGFSKFFGSASEIHFVLFDF